jgi:hypothetical protein
MYYTYMNLKFILMYIYEVKAYNEAKYKKCSRKLNLKYNLIACIIHQLISLYKLNTISILL